MSKKIKKAIGLLLGTMLFSGLLIGAFVLLNCFVSWVCANNGRYVIGIIIIGYVVYKMIKRELDN